jgi:hypothetical protein
MIIDGTAGNVSVTDRNEKIGLNIHGKKPGGAPWSSKRSI